MTASWPRGRRHHGVGASGASRGTRIDYDIVVVGAGPAGTAAALAARRVGLSVLLIDRAEFPRDKVCGDGIAPHALDVYAGLGVDVANLVRGSEPITALSLRSPSGIEAIRRPRGIGYVVPREVFDARLLTAARAAGADLSTRTVRHVELHADFVDVEGVRAAVVVGADGAESVVRSAAGVPPPRPGTVALALRGYATASGRAGEQQLLMTAQHWPAYAWSFPVGDGTANVGYGELLQGAPPTRSQMLRRMTSLLPGVEADRIRGHRLPLSTGRQRQPDGRILLVGDAAGLVNPLTGEGIFYAALSGSLAGGAAAHGADAGAVLRNRLRAELGRHFRHTDALAFVARRPWMLDAGVAAAARHCRPFDAYFELGLGRGRLDVATALRIGAELIPGWKSVPPRVAPAPASGPRSG